MQKNTIFQKLIYMLTFFILAGCTTMQPIDKGLTPDQIVQLLKPGDEVIIRTIDNEKHLILIESISPDKIIGSGKSFEFVIVKEIKIEQFDGWKTYTNIFTKTSIFTAVVSGLLVIRAIH